MKKITLITIIMSMTLGLSLAFADAPVLFFSDLIDGPKTGWEGSSTKGAAVSIWGKNLGTTRGTSYVTVGGVNLTADTDYAEWGVTTGNARGMERITFYLRSSCASGTGTITVTVGGVTSNTLPFYVRTIGNIRFVDHNNGNNSNNGVKATNQGGGNGPWKTLAYSRQQINGGDVLYIRTGTYTEADDWGIIYADPNKSGSTNNYTAFVGYPNELPLLDTRTNSIGSGIRNCYDNAHHFVFSKIKIYPRGIAVDISQNSGGYIRVVGLDIDGVNKTLPNASTWSGNIDFHDMSNAWILGCKIHDWGRDKYDHAIYIGNNVSGTNLINFEIAWNEVYNLGDDVSGIYIHPQDTDSGHSYADEIDIHDNLCHDLEHAGILMYSRTKDIRIYNNIIYNCGTQGDRSAVQLTPDAYYTTYLKFYNNTIYSSSNAALLYLGYGGLNADLKNNIFYSLSSTPYISKDSNPTVTSDYDLFYGNGAAPSYATHALNSNPLFINAGAANFNIQELSSANNAGTSAVSAIVTRDYCGLSRPQGAGYDIGAYEYASGTVADTELPTTPANLTATAVSVSQIDLSWNASTDNVGVSGYKIYRGGSQIATSATTSYSNTGLTASTTYQYQVSAYDAAGNESGLSLVAQATTNANRAPVLGSIGNKSVNEGSTLSFQVSATDADSDTLTYSTATLPSGATFTAATRTFSWTPSTTQSGTYSVTFTVNDGHSGTDSETITITVVNVPTPAEAIDISTSATPATGTAPLAVNFTASATSTNGPIVRYEWDFEGKGSYVWASSTTGNCSYVYSGAGNYTATVRVTDQTGAQDTYARLIQVQNISTAPQVTVTTSQSTGAAPLKVYFRVNATSSIGISKYEWDFEGDGIYENKSRKSGNLIKTYSKPGIYTATVRVTDFAAVSKTAETIINVSNNSSLPSISLSLNAQSGTAPFNATLTANNLNNSSLIRYEWDFDGDGAYDKSTYNENSVTYTYRQAGTFTPRARVTNKDNLSQTATNQITISENASVAKPAASFIATPAQGEAPLSVSFTDQSTGAVTLKTWDFNGDLTDDWALSTGDLSYVYNDAGYYVVSLKARNSAGMTDKASRQIKIISLDSEPLVIIAPKNSQVIKGYVSLSVIIDPRIAPNQVTYQYQLQGNSTWNNIGTSTEYPYFLRWDTTVVADSAYLIRAVASNGSVYTSDSVTITVNNQTSTPDSQENTTATGEYLKQTNIDSAKSEETYLYDGTKVEIPSQTVNSDDTLSITILDADLLSNKVNSSDSGLTDMNSYRNISLASATSLLEKEAVVRIPYEDKDNDGYVDGSTVAEETLDLYRYDEASGEWLKAFDIIVHPDENYVEAKTNHFSLFGLAGAAAGATAANSGGGGGGGGCFIATACFGTEMADEVVLLKKFRDQRLLNNKAGAAFVRFYYRHAPPVADFIRNKPALKAMVRFCLRPLVKLARHCEAKPKQSQDHDCFAPSGLAMTGKAGLAMTEKAGLAMTESTGLAMTESTGLAMMEDAVSSTEEKENPAVIARSETTKQPQNRDCFAPSELAMTVPTFTLIGTVIDPDRVNSLAIIEDASTHQQRTLKTGESISGFQIVKIARAEITLLKDGKLFPLAMPSGNINEPIRSVSEREKVINREAIAKIIPDLNTAVNQAVALPHLEAGKISGFRIAKILNKELAEKAGIKEGDIVLSVNGNKIDGLKKPFEVYRQMRNEPELRVQIKRKGEIKNLVYYLN